jgi:hypothetical protein
MDQRRCLTRVESGTGRLTELEVESNSAVARSELDESAAVVVSVLRREVGSANSQERHSGEGGSRGGDHSRRRSLLSLRRSHTRGDSRRSTRSSRQPFDSSRREPSAESPNSSDILSRPRRVLNRSILRLLENTTSRHSRTDFCREIVALARPRLVAVDLVLTSTRGVEGVRLGDDTIELMVVVEGADVCGWGELDEGTERRGRGGGLTLHKKGSVRSGEGSCETLTSIHSARKAVQKAVVSL